MDMNSPQEIEEPTVVVAAPARLHLGFTDLQRASGRSFGSLGLAIEAEGTSVAAQRADESSAAGPLAARALGYLRVLQQRFASVGDIRLQVLRASPEHAGLGAGTQLALAVGAAVSQVCGESWSAREVATMLDRGARSGIGLGAFEGGGFLVDAGRGEANAPPPIIGRVPFPPHWRVILVLDTLQRGLHGEAEAAAFRELPEFPLARSAELCRLLLTRIMPGLAQADMDEFGPALTELQCTVGDHFAPAQGGRYTSARVAAVLAWFETLGVKCVGQSSWGPTGFAIVDSEAFGAQLQREAQARWPSAHGVTFRLTSGRNRGAQVQIVSGSTPHAQIQSLPG